MSPQATGARFYQKIAPTLTRSAVPVCYDAQCDDTNNHVFLACVAQTHFAPPEALPMPLVCHEMIVDALADLHSQFWDHPRLQHDIGTLERDGPAFSFAAASQH